MSIRITWIIVIIIFLGCQSQRSIESDSGELIDSEILLGKTLFFDPILSADQTIACASCHKPQFAFADNVAFSKGVKDSIGKRNAPSVMNMASRSFFFHDGRANSLEEQARFPIEDQNEMNMDFKQAVKRVQNHKSYVKLFNEIYSSAPIEENIVAALAAFQISLESNGTAPLDLWMRDTEPNAMTESQIRGRDIFLSERAKCFDCHFGPDFTQDEFKNIGLYDGVTLMDKGRYEITKSQVDLGKFKVPGLRNVALTAPYMHNGMFNTLEEVVDYYSNPYEFIAKPINIDSLMIKPIHFTEEEKKDLVAFLHSLTDREIPYQNTSIQHLK